MSGKAHKFKYEAIASRYWSNLSLILKEKGLTWTWLAERMGDKTSSLAAAKYFNNNVTIGTACTVANLLNVTLDELILDDRASKIGQ